jgi:hypothetical protein
MIDMIRMNATFVILNDIVFTYIVVLLPISIILFGANLHELMNVNKLVMQHLSSTNRILGRFICGNVKVQPITTG